MKNHLFSLCAFLSITLLAPAAAYAGGPVAVQIKKVDKTVKTPADSKKNTPAKETENNKLEITLRNGSREDYKGLQVQYFFVGHDIGESQNEVLKKGQSTLDLAPGATGTVTSDEFVVLQADAYTFKGKRIKAIGKKVTGYGAQVKNGETIVGEFFSSEAAKLAINPPAKP